MNGRGGFVTLDAEKKEISFEIIAQFLSPWHEMVKITERTSFRKILALKRRNQHLDDLLTFSTSRRGDGCILVNSVGL